MNFLEETILALNENNKDESDVLFVADRQKQIKMTWDDFKSQAKEINYRPDFQNPMVINFDLTIVGKDFYLERDEYCDREEWWVFKKTIDENIPYGKVTIKNDLMEEGEHGKALLV